MAYWGQMIGDKSGQKFVFDWGKISLLEVSGPDGKDFLHRLSTINFKRSLAAPIFGAFLNGQAKLISIFTAWEKDQKIFLFIEPNMFEATYSYLEQMHFAENLTITKKETFGLEFRNARDEKQIDAYNWGLAGFYIFADEPIQAKQKSDAELLSREKFNALRAWYGFANPLVDLTNDHLLIEAPLDDLVDRSKGCYPGQEVIEKIYTYGRLPKKILRVDFIQEPQPIALPVILQNGDENIGALTSVYELNGKCFGIATLKRLFLEKNKFFKSQNLDFSWQQV